ncbi:MAG: XRE family transcriptional regulator [Rhodospirillales bacterium]|nr:MAG: XRE family transcriptional regulator [Rhodospirillales bacterium]
MRRIAAEVGPDPIDRYVGTRIRGRRVGLRISQTKLGHAIGVTFQQIQKYESGTNRVGASNLYRIARALGVDVSFFFEGLNAETRIAGAPMAAAGLADVPMAEFEGQAGSPRESYELLQSYFRIPDPDVRRRLFQLVRTLAHGTEGG